MRVVITKELDEIWGGIDDLIEDLGAVSIKERDAAIVELLQEDVAELLDGATWRIEE